MWGSTTETPLYNYDEIVTDWPGYPGGIGFLVRPPDPERTPAYSEYLENCPDCAEVPMIVPSRAVVPDIVINNPLTDEDCRTYSSTTVVYDDKEYVVEVRICILRKDG